MMKYKNWSLQIWSEIDAALDAEKHSTSKIVAAFDADGTLWDTDLGESFFKFQIRQNLLKGLPSDPWRHYHDWKEKGDPRPAYVWLAQINAGHPLSQVQDWAERACREQNPLPIFEDQKRLIEKLQQQGVEVFVVTASIKWAVEPGAKRLGIDANHVLGIETQVENGLVTDKPSGVITWREGKAKALLQATNGRIPFLCSGNTMGDFQLLETASHIRLVVGASQENDDHFQTEKALQQEGMKRRWLVHQF